MDSVTIECLRCGHARSFHPGPRRCEEAGECPRCGYVGWAFSSDLNESARRLLREVPLDHRPLLRPVA